MSTNELLLREDQGAITRLTLNRPAAYNALSLELMERLIDEFANIAADTRISVVILRGSGRGFCAGHDLKQMTEGADHELQQRTFATCSRLMMTITELPLPVIAEVHGIATAAGCQLVATCDLAVCSDDARFATPGVNIGLFCSTPMVALTRNIAPKHAMEMLLTGEMISAQRAYEMGLVNRVVTADELPKSVMTLAETLASKSSATLAVGKQAFHAQLPRSLADAYAHCSEVMTCNIQSEDAQEGIDAFLNKRTPRWKGR
ncbi:enoyl-CoA hydratase [Motiliproteus sediminis]|uniref:enoyl-CoA hydratase n=1 Tax=Motiliproteus sediminis TaxID=1468178 RepID=UPI001AEFD6A7|nr:enoyl-CoA hydratase [Motiliproteus sediminis]